MADAEKLLRRTIGENIDLRITVAEDLRCTEMDRGQIEQILMNLVVNARDAMPQGGKVIIQTSNESIDEERARTEPGMVAGEYVCISVTDSGEGMTKEVQSHVFEPFFTTKPRGKGTGLGLATIYGIVKRAGGYVSVYSEPGWGATFRVYLPVSQAQPTLPAREAEPDATKGGGETVLVVEDEEAVRNLVNRILTRSGYRVLQAASGQEAIELLEKEGPIELLLTDVIMPDMSGKELAQRLPAGSEGFKTLYMSGYTDEIVAREGILEAGVAFIQKPFNAGDLAKRVRQVLTV